MKELGSEAAQRPDEEVFQQSKCSQSIQPNPNPDHDRMVKPIVCPQRGAREASRSQEIDTSSFREEAVKHDRTGKPVVCRDTSHAQGASQTRFSHDSTNFNVEDETNHDRTEKLVVCCDANHEQSMLNKVDVDFRIPGLPHSVVKQAENNRVRALVKKMAREMGSPRQVFNRRRRTLEGPEPACVQTPLTSGWHTQGVKDELTNILPWYRLVGVAIPPVRRKGGRTRLPKKGEWSLCGMGTIVVIYPCPAASCVSVAVRGCARVAGKAGENGQHSGEMGGSSPWTRPSALGCGDTLKALARDQHLI